MKPRVAVHYFGVRHYAGEVTPADLGLCDAKYSTAASVGVSDAPLWPVAGGVRCEGDAGEEQGHFQRRRPQHAEGEQVRKLSSISAEVLTLPSVNSSSVFLTVPLRLDFVYDLFEHVLSRNKEDTLKSSSKHRRPTVSTQFKVSHTNTQRGHPHYLRPKNKWSETNAATGC